MGRIFTITSLILLYVFGPTTCGWTQYTQTYNFYMEMGQEALDKKDYTEALDYFNHAHLVDPSRKEPLHFVNLIKRLTENRVQVIEPKKRVIPKETYRRKIIPPTVYSAPKESNQTEVIPNSDDSIPERSNRNEVITQMLDSFEAKKTSPTPMPTPSVRSTPAVITITEEPSKTKENTKNTEPQPIYLNDALWATQPKTLLQIELNTTVIVEGQQLDRFLIITPGFIEVERIDRNHLKITAQKRGSTFLHIWDDRGRWTFNVEVIYALPSAPEIKTIKDTKEIYSKPFRFAYSADWGSYYRGQSLDTAERQSLNFLQWSGLTGETPYGDFDSYVIANKFDQSTEVTGYSVGLTNGHLGDFNNFTIRGFDNTKTFSPLSVPGQYFRGVLVESPAFHDNFKYAYFKGRDRATYGFLAPNVLEKRESFVEGLKLTLFPRKDDQYSFNWARGYGNSRDTFLKNHVASFQAQHRFNKWLVAGENAFNDDIFARTLSSKFDQDDFHFHMNFRDIDRDFTTITSLPSNRGEIGGMLGFNWNLAGVDLDTNLDLYQDRALPNEEDPNALNLDFSSSAQIPLSRTERLSTSLFYVDTAGELSPRKNLRFNNTYSKRFSLGHNRELNTFLGSTYQMSRYKFSPTSEYDRYSLNAGFSVPLVKGLSYYANYEYSWVDDLSTSKLLKPTVFNTGINYHRTLTEHWTLHSDFSYRDEEGTDGLNSFLAGEDSTTGSIGLSYKPTLDFEFFIDGRVRNVWAENNRATAFNEIDIRSGIRSAWELPIVWNPRGQIDGIVFKDLNNNKKQDPEESGIANVHVNVGKKQTKTDTKGHYKTSVHAKSVEVSLDTKTIPSGFIFSTPSLVNTLIIPHRTQHVNFGLTTNSGIYGVVFFDENQNGKPDSYDVRISKVKIILDGKESTTTDFEGNYFFSNIGAGTHQMTIDINSIPIEYLPAVKIKNEVDVSEGTTYVFHIPLNKNSKTQE